MIKGIIKIVILTLLIAIANYGISYFNLAIPFGESFYPILAFFCFQSITIHVLFKLCQSTFDIAIHLLVMGAMTIRLISALMAVTIFIMIGVQDMVNFIITFFMVYLIYFVFEIITVLSNLRSNLK